MADPMRSLPPVAWTLWTHDKSSPKSTVLDRSTAPADTCWTVGIEYQHYLLPKRRAFRPDADQLRTLIDRLIQGGWIVSPDSPALKQMTFDTSKHYKNARKSGA